jgi:hypothetical protein
MPMPDKGHYLTREPGLALPGAALVLNFVLIVLLLFESRAMKKNVHIAFSSGRPTLNERGHAPTLEVSAGESFRLDGQEIATLADLEFRLEGRASAGSALILRLDAAASAARLTEILNVCTRTGFTNIAIESPPEKNP